MVNRNMSGVGSSFSNGLVPGSEGLWCDDLRHSSSVVGRPALFLDRDGVIVKEVGYLHKLEDVQLIDNVHRIIAQCNQVGIPVILVTNQSGIGRGLYSWSDFTLVQDKITRLLSGLGAHLDMVLACAYHDEGEPPYRRESHPWRKPNPGMLLAAAEQMEIKLSESWIVGDREGDIAAGRAAGLAGGVLALSGHTSQQEAARISKTQDKYKIRVAYSLAACPFLVKFMGPSENKIQKLADQGVPVSRDTYNELKRDEQLLRNRLGLPPVNTNSGQ